MIIVGAGLSGLLAACRFPKAAIFEAGNETEGQHKALLRFRSNVVSELTGIPFKRVRVSKGIFFYHNHQPLSIRAINLYSQKVLGGKLSVRSIGDIKPVNRWVAPHDFAARLIDRHKGRIEWGTPWPYEPRSGTAVISTAPLPLVLEKLAPAAFDDLSFRRKAIHVFRYKVPDCDVYQTIYFPGEETPVYRASITGDILIIECVVNGAPFDLEYVCGAFGIAGLVPELQAIDAVEQKFGKIEPLPDSQRKALLHMLTAEHSIYSLGRFATWRNILLDDVVQDLQRIEDLIHYSDYERRIFASRKEN